jgi:hypothetical protein
VIANFFGQRPFDNREGHSPAVSLDQAIVTATDERVFAVCRCPELIDLDLTALRERGELPTLVSLGYQVVFVPFHDGHPAGGATPFFSGFVPDPAGKAVYGRMVGVAEAADGALLISDDAGKLIWLVSYEPGN